MQQPEGRVPKNSVPILTGTFFNAGLFIALVIYQLCAIPHFRDRVFGHDVPDALVFNILFTVLALLIVVFLIFNKTLEGGHCLALILYYILIGCAGLVFIFERGLFARYFNIDFLALVWVGTVCCGLGLGVDMSWKSVKAAFKREYFTMANVRYYLQDHIFVDNESSLRKSITIACVLLVVVALVFVFHPLTRLFSYF